MKKEKFLILLLRVNNWLDKIIKKISNPLTKEERKSAGVVPVDNRYNYQSYT